MRRSNKVILGFASVITLAVHSLIVHTEVVKEQKERTKSVQDPKNDFIYAGRRLSEWIGLLESDAPHMRLSAVRALGEIGPRAKPAVSGLINRLAADDEFLRSEAAFSLGEIGPEAAAAIPAMVRTLKKSRYFHQGTIAPAIARIGPAAIPALVDVLRDSPGLRGEVIHALSLMGPQAKDAIPCLTKMLSDRDGSVREEAAFTLWTITHRRDMIEIITNGLADDLEFTRMGAADHLGEIGPDAEAAVPALIRALDDRSSAVLNRSAQALERIGPTAKDAVPALMRAVGGPHPGFRLFASQAAAGIGSTAVPPLIEALENRNGEVRRAAAEALGMIGPAAKDAAPRLAEMMAGPAPLDRLSAATALWRIQHDERSVAVLVEILQTKDFLAQVQAMTALEDIGPQAKEAVSTLVEVLNMGDHSLRWHAANALGRIGPGAKDAVSALETNLKGQEQRIRVASALALWRVARADTALSALIKDLRDAGPSTREAATALSEIGPEAQAAVPALIDALENDSENRATIARALGQIGPAAKAAVPALIEAYSDDTFLVRESIGKSLKAIDPDVAARAGIRVPFGRVEEPGEARHR